MDDPRRPGQVPDDPVPGSLFEPQLDVDCDGVPDTAVTGDGVDLVVLTDVDGDRFADQVLRIGPDGVVREAGPQPSGGPGSGVVDGLLGGAAAGSGF
jgi:hypothetical protein